MKMRFSASGAVFTCLALAACQPQDAGTVAEAEYDAPDFASLNEAYDAAVNAADAQAIGMMYAEDAVSMPPNEAELVGRAAIIANAAEDFAAITPNLSSSHDGSLPMGDMVVEWGSYSFSGALKEGGMEIAEDGKYLAVWQRQTDGSWQIVRDIWNANSTPEMEMEGEGEM